MVLGILKKSFFVLVLILGLVFVLQKVVLPFFDFGPARVSQGIEENILDNLTLEQKIGQLFIVGFEGEILTPEVENLIKTFSPGGVLLLQRNIKSPEQLKNLIESLQEVSLKNTGLPLFIAVDQEGGLISRVDFAQEKTPQSEIETIEQAYQIGLERGRELKELGINLNLAPLLDLAQPGDFLFARAFRKEPSQIGQLAYLVMKGQEAAGILTAIKHFPGYTGIAFNPEEELAVLPKLPEISQFQEAVKNYPSKPFGIGVSPAFVMTANVIYQELDSALPFTFSEKGIQFLQEKLGEQILIMSDDLSQNSLRDRFSLKEIVSLPVKAGVDMLIFSGWRSPVPSAILALQKAVQDGEISEQRINQSVSKILELKQKVFKRQP